MEVGLKFDRRALGGAILYKIIENKDRSNDEKKSIWDEFKEFSRVLGDDFMDFPNFEHFYLKLEKGECDVEYDGRLRYNRNLSDLPANIIRLIAQRLTNGQKWILRETSSSLRKMIDPCLAECRKMNVQISESRKSVTFEGDKSGSRLQIDYSMKRSEETGESEVHRSVMGCEFGFGGRTWEEALIGDIARILKKPKTRLTHLNFNLIPPKDSSFFENLKLLLKSQEDVKYVFIDAISPVMFHSILSCLKPKTLEDINLKSHAKDLDFGEILEMDQIKQAKQVRLCCWGASYSLESAMQLENFDGDRDSLEPEDILMIKNELARTGKMKNFAVYTSQKMILHRINEVLGPLNPEFDDTMHRRHFRIQNSDEFMKLELSGISISFSRVKTVKSLESDSDANDDEYDDSD